MKKLISPHLLVAALTLSLGLAANSYAMPRGGHHGPDMGMPGQHAMYHDRAMSRLHDELKLDEKQDALWKDADKFAQDTKAGARDSFQKRHDEIKGMLDQPGADLRALSKRMDDLRADGMKQRDAVRERWLAVYDSLNPEQKEKARLFFKTGMERFDRTPRKAGGRW
jgi:hypothetical protein